MHSVNDWLEIDPSGYDVLGLQELGGFSELSKTPLQNSGLCEILTSESDEISDYLVVGTDRGESHLSLANAVDKHGLRSLGDTWLGSWALGIQIFIDHHPHGLWVVRVHLPRHDYPEQSWDLAVEELQSVATRLRGSEAVILGDFNADAHRPTDTWAIQLDAAMLISSFSRHDPGEPTWFGWCSSRIYDYVYLSATLQRRSFHDFTRCSIQDEALQLYRWYTVIIDLWCVRFFFVPINGNLVGAGRGASKIGPVDGGFTAHSEHSCIAEGCQAFLVGKLGDTCSARGLTCYRLHTKTQQCSPESLLGPRYGQCGQFKHLLVEHFRGVFGAGDTVEHPPDGCDPCPLHESAKGSAHVVLGLEEVAAAVSKISVGKSCGLTGISGDFLRALWQ